MTTHSIQFAKRARHPSHHHTKAFGNQFLPIKPGPSTDKKHQKLVDTAQKWVGQTFYGQMLKQMRDSPFKSKMFEGGREGEAFNAMFDQNLATRMSKGAGRPLVDAIVSRIEAGKAYAASAKSANAASSPAAAISSFRGVI
jgi:Rod binding domain-containing protein